MAVFAVVALIFSKKANFAQFEGNHCAFLFILTYNSEILCKFAIILHSQTKSPSKPTRKQNKKEYANKIRTTKRLARSRDTDTWGILERISPRMHLTLRTEQIPFQPRLHPRTRPRLGRRRKDYRSCDVLKSSRPHSWRGRNSEKMLDIRTYLHTSPL